MKVLLTGGAGFLATDVSRLLRSRGVEVITVDRRGRADIRMDLSVPSDVAGLPPVDTVVHCAAVQYVDPEQVPFFGRSAFFRTGNAEVTRLLTGHYANRCSHFVNISTSMIYHQCGRELYPVDAACRAQGHYSCSKIEAQAYVDAMPVSTATIIPCIIAGEGRGGLFESLLRSMRRYQRVFIPGRGDHPIHLVHVEDCASLVALAVEHRLTGRFNAASPEPQSIRQWIKDIEMELEWPSTRVISLPLAPVFAASAMMGYIPVPKERLLMLKYPHVLSVEEGQRAGWSPKWPNAAIVRQTAAYLANRNEERQVPSQWSRV